MFTNKEEFKQQYCQRMIEKYGRSIQYSRCSERYLVLGEMVKDYASNNWMETKNKIDEKQAANLPKPPLPKPASVSTSSSSLISYPNSDNPSLTIL